MKSKNIIISFIVCAIIAFTIKLSKVNIFFIDAIAYNIFFVFGIYLLYLIVTKYHYYENILKKKKNITKTPTLKEYIKEDYLAD